MSIFKSLCLLFLLHSVSTLYSCQRSAHWMLKAMRIPITTTRTANMKSLQRIGILIGTNCLAGVIGYNECGYTDAKKRHKFFNDQLIPLHTNDSEGFRRVFKPTPAEKIEDKKNAELRDAMRQLQKDMDRFRKWALISRAIESASK